MNFQKLPLNSRALLREIVTAENPAEFLCDMFKKASPKEDAELRGVLRELKEKGYINIQWADNKPYRIIINNSARTYEEQLTEYNMQKHSLGSNSITIGNNNTIKDSTIANSVVGSKENEKEGFYERHPVICGILISLLTGIILLFSFWKQMVSFIEGLL